MDELEVHVNHLFAKYAGIREMQELKAEVLGNLEAKRADLMASGMDRQTATTQTKAGLTTVDGLVDGNRCIYLNRYRREWLQRAFLFIVIGWVATIPLFMFRGVVLLNSALLCGVIVAGIASIAMHGNKSPEWLGKRRYLNLNDRMKWRRWTWIAWTVFMLFATLMTTGLLFASNIWFGWQVKIGGPYQFALVVIRYAVPFITIFVPLFMQSLPKMMMKHEVGEADEKPEEIHQPQ